MKTGFVYIVGGGPGDPGLITQKAIECLNVADVIIYDHLINDHLLNYSALKAERIYAGKKAHIHEMEQKEINQLLVKKAKLGKIVVRLKGGDPLIFGRGGEEIEVLVKNHIPFQIIPGVSSAIAVPAYAGIPLTYRGISSSFVVITGHESKQKNNSSVCWEKLATGTDTLVFLMGMNNLAQIVRNVIKHGRDPDTPIAIIENGTTPDQKIIIGQLKNIEDKAKKQQLKPPSVIVIGEVVKLSKKFQWLHNSPLFGKRILVTRPKHQSKEFSDLLKQKGAWPIEIPTITIEPSSDFERIDNKIRHINQYQWILFTSVNGVDMFFRHLNRLKLDVRIFHNNKIGAIGPATARLLESKGILVDFMPDQYTSQGILSWFMNQDITGQRILLPSTNLVNNELINGLKLQGAIVEQVTVYKTGIATENAHQLSNILTTGNIDVICFTSSSTVSNLTQMIGGQVLPGNILVACMGTKTAAAAVKAGFKVDIVATTSTIPGLVSDIEMFFMEEK